MPGTSRSKALRIGAVAYDPKVVTIWEGFKDYFAACGVEIDFILYSTYDAQVEANLCDAIDVAWNSPLAWVKSQIVSRGAWARMARCSNLPWLAATRCCQPPHPMRLASGASNRLCKTAARCSFKSESKSISCCLDRHRNLPSIRLNTLTTDAFLRPLLFQPDDHRTGNCHDKEQHRPIEETPI